MNQLFDISIVIPVYNVRDYILECLESVSSQVSKARIECILVDDCGQDDSIVMAEKFITTYVGPIFFKIVKHDHNKGLSAARNTAIYVAKGKYLYFLDGDDKLYPYSMDVLFAFTKKYPNIDIVQGNLYSEDIGKVLFSNNHYCSFSSDHNWIRKGLATLRIPESACNRLIKKRIIIENNLLFREGWIHEDTLWTYQLHDYINSIAFCYKPTYYYRKNNNSIMHSSSRNKEANAFIRIYNYVYNLRTERRVKLYDAQFLQLLSMRIIKANGIEEQSKVDSKGFLFDIMWKLENMYVNNISSIFFRGIHKICSYVLLPIICVKINKKL